MRQLVLIAALFVVLLFTACSGIGDADPNLVGTWLYDVDTRFVYTLNADGTGTRGTAENFEEIEWGVSGNELRINRQGNVPEGEIANERWYFTITDSNFLRLQSTIDDTRIDHLTLATFVGTVDSALVDTWVWDEDMFWAHTFNADGTGYTGRADEYFTFSWGTMDNILRKHFDRHSFASDYITEQIWTFEIIDDSLRLESRHHTAEVHNYIRGIRITETDLISAALFGTWFWDGADTEWTYQFFDNGFGMRGRPDYLVEFEWRSHADRVLIFPGGMESGIIESWHYNITDGNLRLENVHDDRVFYYINSTAALLGTWHWEEDHEWIYVFKDDATGIRDQHGDVTTFDWEIAGTELRLTTTVMTELWTFELDEDMLHLQSLQASGLAYSYIREQAE